MSRAALLLAVLLASLVQVCTGWLQGASGTAAVDLVLVLVMGAVLGADGQAALLCAILGGVLVGAPAGQSVWAAIVYALAVVVTWFVTVRRYRARALLVAVVAVAATMALATGQPAAMWSQAWHNAALVGLLSVALGWAGRSVARLELMS